MAYVITDFPKTRPKKVINSPGGYPGTGGPYQPPQPPPNDWPVPPSGGTYPGNYYPGAPPDVQTMGAPGGPLETNPNTGVTPPNYGQGGYQTAGADDFDPSKVPADIPEEWARDFIKRNPGDYHRLGSAYKSGQTGGGGGGGSSAPSQAWNNMGGMGDGFSNELYELLMKRARQGLNIDRMDPSIRQQVDPLIANMTRQGRNYLDAQAERAGPIANLRGEERLMAERTGQAAGQLEAEVIGRERDAIRNEIAQALGLWSSQAMGDKSNALSRYLGELSNATTRRGQDFGFDEFLRELALRQWMARDDSDYRWSRP